MQYLGIDWGTRKAAWCALADLDTSDVRLTQRTAELIIHRGFQ